MVWFPDILIEYRGMSIVTALFFTGVFFFIGFEWMYIKDRFRRIEKSIDRNVVQIKETEKCLNGMQTELAVIRTTVEKVDKSLERIIDAWNGNRLR